MQKIVKGVKFGIFKPFLQPIFDKTTKYTGN